MKKSEVSEISSIINSMAINDVCFSNKMIDNEDNNFQKDAEESKEIEMKFDNDRDDQIRGAR